MNASVIIRDYEGRVIRRSKNLRGIRDYPCYVERVDMWGAQLGVTWLNGAFTIVNFADANMLRQWVGRRRMFSSAKINDHGVTK